MNDQIDFLKVASTMMNFHCKFIQLPKIKSLFNSLHHLGIDILLLPVGYATKDNNLAPLDSTSYDIITRMPEPYVPKTYFLTVFNINLWICFILVIGLVTLMLIVHHKLYKLGATATIGSIMLTLGMTSSTDDLNIPCKLSVNLINFVTSIICFFIGTCMSAFLCAELITTKSLFPFKDLNSFWNQNQYGICASTQDVSFMFLLIFDPDKRLLNNENCDHYEVNFNKPDYNVIDKICDNRSLTVYYGTTELFNWSVRRKGDTR